MAAGYAGGVLWSFIPIAALVTVTPGPATAMVVRSALGGGWRAAVLTIAGNSLGVITWALLSVLGVAALVSASEVAFLALKLVGGAVLVWLGVQSLLHAGDPARLPERTGGGAFRAGLVTSLANPKLAVFFVALFPQFVGDRGAVLPTALLMAALIVTFDVAWYTSLAMLVSRAKQGFMRSRLARRLEQATGAVLVALGLRVALEQR
jgi:threonine/homoserine/homoserine lactone efflux protein